MVSNTWSGGTRSTRRTTPTRRTCSSTPCACGPSSSPRCSRSGTRRRCRCSDSTARSAASTSPCSSASPSPSRWARTTRSWTPRGRCRRGALRRRVGRRTLLADAAGLWTFRDAWRPLLTAQAVLWSAQFFSHAFFEVTSRRLASPPPPRRRAAHLCVFLLHCADLMVR